MSATPSEKSKLPVKKSETSADLAGLKTNGSEGPSRIVIVSLTMVVGLLTILWGLVGC